MKRIGNIAWLALASPILNLAQTTPPATVPAQIVVTIGHHYGHGPAQLTRDDLTVTTTDFKPLAVECLTPLRGDRAALELYVVVDSCSNCEPGSKFAELRQFIGSQPPTTAVGVAYIVNGRMKIAETPTSEHDRAIEALNVPEGTGPANPYMALTDLIAGWPQGSSRRAVIIVSNGIDPASHDTGLDASAESAIEAAQSGGITVYAIYHPSADYFTSDVSKLFAGQIQLAHVAEDTGGEAYFISFGPLPSLAPFLADIADHLANQYLLEVLANAVDGPGALREVTVKSKSPDVELMVPEKLWVAGHGTDPLKEIEP